jgi:arginyl-tRNA synthetase
VIVLKKLQILVAIAILISIMSFAAYAETPASGAESNGQLENNKEILKGDKGDKSDKGDKDGKCHKDPIKRLEERKERVQKDYKEGKITKEEADKITKKLDEHITKIKEFNSLSLPEKKDHLSKRFNIHLDNQIAEGKLTKEEGAKLLEDFNKDLKDWDGKEPPRFMHKHRKAED